MQFAIIFLAVLAAASAVPIRSEIRDPAGQFTHRYSAPDAEVAEEQRLTPSFDGLGLVPQRSGHINYISPEGIPVSISYVADQFGARFSGSHVPQPNPIV